MSPVLPELEAGTRNLVHYHVVLKCALVARPVRDRAVRRAIGPVNP
jgi:hypothetical protein